MRRYFCIFLFFFSLLSAMHGQGMHLIMDQVGDGAFVSLEEGTTEPVRRASFIPMDSRITVRARSGIETMSAGYLFRYGADTRFTLSKEALQLHDGSIMIQSRKIGNRIVFKSPEASLRIAGIGTCMIEVETNGGLKVIGILGRMIVGVGDNGVEEDLLAGELVFVKPGNSGLGDKINVNLERVVETSFLLSGFQNGASFQGSLTSVVRAQKESIGKTYRAEVGDAKGTDTFEIVTNTEVLPEEKNRVDVESENSSLIKNRSNYKIPGTDPLQELLGRAPKRTVPVIEEKAVSPAPIKLRPLPGTLLRKQN
ncbi:MAG: hypothetical protein HN548_13280 [Opitutae bacterium]|nr:hypothetical protein [Opitutae bacterium]